MNMKLLQLIWGRLSHGFTVSEDMIASNSSEGSKLKEVLKLEKGPLLHWGHRIKQPKAESWLATMFNYHQIPLL